MLLPNRPVRRSAVRALGDWRGAALARAQARRIFSPMREGSRYGVKQAAPANYPGRFVVSQSVRTSHFVARNKPPVRAVRGSRLLTKICDLVRAVTNRARLGGYDPKQLPSRQTEHQAPNVK
jgi:hypothetical protein